jgi:protein SCO1/2
VAEAGGDYTVDHSATVFLMDRTGKFVATIAPDEGDAPARAKLERLSA